MLIGSVDGGSSSSMLVGRDSVGGERKVRGLNKGGKFIIKYFKL